MKLNIDRFCFCKKQTGRLHLYLHSHKTTCIPLPWVRFVPCLLSGCQVFVFTSSTIWWLSFNFQASRNQPILLLSFFRVWESLFRLFSCLASLAVHYHPNKCVSSRTEEQDRKLQKKGRISLVFMSQMHPASLSVLQLQLWILLTLLPVSCSCRTRAKFSCELFGSPGKADALFWASAGRMEWIIHDLNAWNELLPDLLMLAVTQRTRFILMNLHRVRMNLHRVRTDSSVIKVPIPLLSCSLSGKNAERKSLCHWVIPKLGICSSSFYYCLPIVVPVCYRFLLKAKSWLTLLPKRQCWNPTVYSGNMTCLQPPRLLMAG